MSIPEDITVGVCDRTCPTSYSVSLHATPSPVLRNTWWGLDLPLLHVHAPSTVHTVSSTEIWEGNRQYPATHLNHLTPVSHSTIKLVSLGFDKKTI